MVAMIVIGHLEPARASIEELDSSAQPVET
jgi:hypothetical protein